jgi:WD40 repeat protein
MRQYNLAAVSEVRGHRADVRALCSHAGNLVSTGYDGVVHLWDPTWGLDAPALSLGEGSVGRLLALCDVPNHKLLAAAGSDGTIRLWDPRSRGCVATLEGHVSSVSALLVRSACHELFSAGGDEHVLIWDLRTSQGTSSLRGQGTSTRCLAFGGENMEILYTGGGDGQVRAWNCKRDARASVQTYNAVEVLRGPLFGISALAHDAPHALLASAGMDNVIYCWDLSKHSQFTPEGRIRTASKALKGHAGVVNAIAAWGENGLVSASADGTLRTWDPLCADEECGPRRTVQVSQGPLKSSVRCLHALDQTSVCTGSSDGMIHVWQAVEQFL